jgi:hypothetical protein
MLGLGAVGRELLYIWQLKINFQITSISWAPMNAFVGAVIASKNYFYTSILHEDS